MKIKEKTSLRAHPLDLWQSETVYQLLRDFFAANFAEASLPASAAHEFVDTAWNMKQSGDFEAARLACNAVFMKYQKSATKPAENDPLNILDLSGVKTFADIGSNKLSAVNFYMRKYPDIERFYAIDIVPMQSHFHDKKRGHYITVSPDSENFPIPEQSADCVHYRFSLHHFSGLDAIRQSFANSYEILKDGGFLVIWEETFDETFPDGQAERNIREYGLKTDAELTARFYAMSEAERWQFIIADDWLVNTNNAHMPWTGQHYSFSEWTHILNDCGFALKQSYNLGLRRSGRLKQGVHMGGIFVKKNAR